MAIPTHRPRGLQSIRTLSGRVDQQFVPYKAHMRLTCLEMERHRRAQERVSARRTLTELDERLQELEDEKMAILQALGILDGGPRPSHPGGGEDARPARKSGRTRIRY